MQTLPVRAEIANPNPARCGLRSPRGGCTVAGKFYRGGCFSLPNDPANPHGLAVEDATLWAELPGVLPEAESDPEDTPCEPSEAPNVWDPGDSWDTWKDDDGLWWLGPGDGPIGAPAPDLAEFASRSKTVGDGRTFQPAPTRLNINGFNYTALEISAGECGSVAFELHKLETNNRYHVLRDNFGVVSCDCGDYLFRHDGRGTCCKHGKMLVELGLVPAPSPIASTLGRREVFGKVSVLRNATPVRIDYPTRPRRSGPSSEEMAEAAQLFGDLEADRLAYARELAGCL